LQRSQRLRLKQEQIENVAKMDRTKAHFLRMQAASDLTDAKDELSKVYKLDKKLKGIKEDARKKTLEFHQGTQAVKIKHEQVCLIVSVASSPPALLPHHRTVPNI
jgi:hypothetical protein